MLITPKRAFEIVLKNVRPLKSVNKSLSEATGCCLGQDVCADRDSPPTDRSAMDGYAVRTGDLRRPGRELRLVGEVAAGSPKRPRVYPGTCVRILTGGSIPPGANSVVKLEETEETPGLVTFLTTTTVGSNVRKRGEVARKGEVLLPKGTVLGPAQIGVCASVGKAMVRVHPKPRVAVLCTGEELREPGSRVGPHQLRDSNGPSLCAALEESGHENVTPRIVPDAPGVLAAKLKMAAQRHDVVIVTGGVSVGKYDFVPEALGRIGATIRFHGVAMKPGKPQLYATLKPNRHIFGLPGNPLSVLTGFYELVLPAVRRMSGLSVESCRPCLHLPLTRTIRSKGTRSEFVLGRLVRGKNGSQVTPVKSSGSADLVAGARADGVIVVPQSVSHIPKGQMVEFRPWRHIP